MKNRKKTTATENFQGHFHEFPSRSLPTGVLLAHAEMLVDAAGRPLKVRRTYLILRIPTASGFDFGPANVDLKESTRGTESLRSLEVFQSSGDRLAKREYELGAKTRKRYDSTTR